MGSEMCIRDRLKREPFYELLVDDARLVPREPPVLVEDGDERPVLRLAYAPDEAAGAVLALVAVDEYRMIPDVEHLLGGEEGSRAD